MTETLWVESADKGWTPLGNPDPEGTTATADGWGAATLSTTLKRDPSKPQPDLLAFTPVRYEVDSRIVWEGRTRDTPGHSGLEGGQVNVNCEGWQAHLDDDVYRRVYVHSSLTDWVDQRSILSADLTRFTAGWQVQSGDGALVIAWPLTAGAAPNDQEGCVTLDLGEGSTATRVVVTWDATGDGNGFIRCRGGGTPSATEAQETHDQVIGAAAAQTSTTFDFSAGRRYVHLSYWRNNSFLFGSDVSLRFTDVKVFRSTAYESSGVSILHADDILKDARNSATLLISRDDSQISSVSFAFPSFTAEGTARAQMERANGAHGYRLQIGRGRTLVFQPQATRATLVVGNDPGFEWDDASQGGGADIYNRVVGTGTDGAGQPVRVERWASQQPGAVVDVVSSPAATNPSFATNTSGWSSDGTITRDTTTFDSSPASLKFESPAGSVLTGTFTGTFQAGTNYSFTMRVRREFILGHVRLQGSTVSFGDATTGDQSVFQSVFTLNAFQTVGVSWTPSAPSSSATLRIQLAPDTRLFIDSLSPIATTTGTLIERRGFVKTKELQAQEPIDHETLTAICDLFLQAHMRTQFKGSLKITGKAVKDAVSGTPIHPADLLWKIGEIIRIAHIIDPDTGALGRNGIIAGVSYANNEATVAIDNERSSLDRLLERLSVVQGG